MSQVDVVLDLVYLGQWRGEIDVDGTEIADDCHLRTVFLTRERALGDERRTYTTTDWRSH